MEKQKIFISIYQGRLFVCHVEISQTIVPLAHLVLLKRPHWIHTAVPLHSWCYWKNPIEFTLWCPCTLGMTEKPPMSLYMVPLHNWYYWKALNEFTPVMQELLNIEQYCHWRFQKFLKKNWKNLDMLLVLLKSSQLVGFKEVIFSVGQIS